MKKLTPLQLISLVGSFIVLIFFLSMLFLNTIKSEIFNIISSYGYIAIFLITFLVEILAQPIGPEISIISGRVLALNMVCVALITIIASTVASLINYRIGKLFYKKVCMDKHCIKHEKLYKKYGKYGLLVSSIGPVPYVPFCWFSGAFGLSIRNFLYFGIFPRILRIIVVSSLITLFI